MQLKVSRRVFWSAFLCAAIVVLLLAPFSLCAQKKLADFSLVDGSGKSLPLSSFKGKVLLIVNIASQSTYSDQISALSQLQDEYKDRGLIVVGVPSNDFGNCEPGSDAEIQKHYINDLHVSFMVTAKSSLTGIHELPLFTFLTSKGKDGKADKVHWNFTKFIVGRGGNVEARFAPDAAPDSPDFEIALQKALGITPGESVDDTAEPDDSKPKKHERQKKLKAHSRIAIAKS